MTAERRAIPALRVQVADNFQLWEFACKGPECGHAAPINPTLVEMLQHCRGVLEVPLTINSGFRCRVHNQREGGSPTSLHTFGLAADVATPRGYTVDSFAAALSDLHQWDALLLYPWGVHVDMRRMLFNTPTVRRDYRGIAR